MKEFNYENLALNLPDAYAKKETSNNYKFLKSDKHISNLIKDALDKIFDILDFENATGYTLDMYGERLQLKRGTMTDEQYLIMLKAQIAKSMSDGTRSFIIEVLSFILNCDKSEIDKTLQIKSDTDTGYVIIDRLPFAWLIDVGFSQEQMIELIEILLSCGVHVRKAMFTGTLEFGDDEDDYDDFKGLSDDKSSIGGYFGISDVYYNIGG